MYNLIDSLPYLVIGLIKKICSDFTASSCVPPTWRVEFLVV